MAIRIARNDAGNCINFFGSSNPTYWNAVLEGEINEDNPNNINVVNTVRTLEQESVVYEFFNLPYTDFVDKDENTFENASECAQYITDNANVSGSTGTFIFNQTDTLDAQREATNTTVLFSNGDIFAVNSLHASEDTNGTIRIQTIVGARDVYLNIRYYNVSVNNGAVSFNSLSAAVDRLNEVLSGQAVGSDPGSADSGIPTESAAGSFVVYGDRITDEGGGRYTSTLDPGNFDTSNGMVSVESITEPGEYFEFVQNGNWDSSGTGFTFGLFDETTYDQSDLEEDVAGNAVKNVIRLRIRNTSFTFIDPASTAGKINESGFSDDLQTKLTYRLGLDADNRAYIGYVDVNSNLVLVSRTEQPLASQTEIKFCVIMPIANDLDGVGNFTVNTVDQSPALTWYYIESPDGSFHYPLFTSEEQANYVDEEYGTAAEDAGSSHQELFIDEQPSQNIYYMPDTYAFEDESSAPSPLAGVVWNEITTGADADYVPSAYVDNTFTVNELASINLQIKPAGDSATYNVTGIPTGLAFNGFGYLVGNAPEVTGDNVTNPSDTYTITITKANDYGSSVGTLTLVVTNLTAPASPISGFTWDNTSTPLIDADTMGEGSVVTIDETLEDGKRFVMDETWVETNILPNLLADGDEVIIGVASSSADWTSVATSDFDFYMSWRRTANNQIISTLANSASTSALTINSLTNAFYDFGFEVSGTDVYIIACDVGDLNSEPSIADGGTFARSRTESSYLGTFPLTLTIATISAEAGLSTTGITEIDTPTAPTNLTSWTKALNFSGGSEHLKQVTQSTGSNAIRMNGLSQLATANSDSTKTSDHTFSRPWATAIVFQTPNNTTNQHIWNSGEGAGSGDDNIYLRMTGSNGDLYFGWGREGVGYNEYHIGSYGGSYNQSTGQWWGIYISHDGTRLSTADATAANLVNAFDIRLMATNDVSPVFDTLYDVGSDVNNWTSTGVRMDRAITGDFTIGGRGANRSFHGKVASMVVTTLVRGVTKPTDAEIKLMLTDPVKWEDDYKDGQTARYASSGSTFTYGPSNSNSKYATQIWLMGDGTNDSYANGIRNHVDPTDQTNTKLQLNSMASNDIENVNINGLT